MRVLGLVSGGKDSCYCLLRCVAAGHDVVGLGHLAPADPLHAEADSYMYQTAAHELVPLFARAIGLPLVARTVAGTARQVERTYLPTEGDEVEDLYELLRSARGRFDFDAVASGAIWSDYQRVRVESVCARLGLTSLAYLWRREQGELLDEMLDAGVKAVVVKVACLGLEPAKHLGRELRELREHLTSLRAEFGVNVCGEGGEYETFTLDCPLFRSAIVVDRWETVIHSDDAFAPVAFARMIDAHLEEKPDVPERVGDRLAKLNVKTPAESIEAEMSAEDDASADSERPASPSGAVSEGDEVSDDASERVWIGEVAESESSRASMRDDVRDAMGEIERRLRDEGLTFDDLIFVDIVLKDMARFSDFNVEYAKFFAVDPPARACVALSTLDVGFSVSCLASKRGEKQALHVQSVSDWAPANIGPYSQAVRSGDRFYLAGQIALVPGSMEMLDDGIVQQNRLVLRHVDRVLRAASGERCGLENVVVAVGYVTDLDRVETVLDALAAKVGDAVAVVLLVSELPRKAKIEWQVTAHRLAGKELNRSASSFSYETCRADVQIFECGASSFAQLDLRTFDDAPLSETDAIEAVRRTVRDVLARRELAVLRAKAYVKRAGLVRYRDLRDGLRSVLNNLELTPVLGLGKKDCVLTVVLETCEYVKSFQ